MVWKEDLIDRVKESKDVGDMLALGFDRNLFSNGLPAIRDVRCEAESRLISKIQINYLGFSEQKEALKTCQLLFVLQRVRLVFQFSPKTLPSEVTFFKKRFKLFLLSSLMPKPSFTSSKIVEEL